MNRKHGLQKTILLGLLTTFTAATMAMDASLLEMSEQMDKVEKQDFQAAIDKATSCIRARNFPCAESELAKAAKAANSGQEKKSLLASQNGLKNEKQQLANEIRRAEEVRQAQLRRDEEREQARVRNEEENEARREREEQEARAEADRQSTSEANASIGAYILQKGAENAAILGRVDRQTNAAIAQANRVRADQAAERDRNRADAERERTNAQRIAQLQDRNEANARNQREADAARAQHEQEQKRLDDERHNQEVRDSNERKRVADAEAAKQKADAAAAKLAEQQAAKQASEQYLRAMQSGIRLGVKNCYGQYEVGGKKPNIKPEVVSCIDVHYRARCEGSTVNYDGVHKNFTGFDAGCFGDTATISPKPECPVNQVHVDVVEVRGCGG